jgi:hypothetical protein
MEPLTNFATLAFKSNGLTGDRVVEIDVTGTVGSARTPPVHLNKKIIVQQLLMGRKFDILYPRN